MSVYLETDRLILRDWKDEDLEHFARINSDPIIMEYYPSRLDEAASKRLIVNFQKHIDKFGYGFFAVESKENEGAFVGFSGLSHVPRGMPIAPAVEIAWRFDYTYWGKGYASEAARAILAHDFPGLEREDIVAYCVEDNVRAKHVLEKLGFDRSAVDDFSYASKRAKNVVRDYHLYRLQKPA